MSINCFPEVKVIDKLSGCASISGEDGWWVPFKSTIGRAGDDVDVLCFLFALSSSDINFFLLHCHCGLDRQLGLDSGSWDSIKGDNDALLDCCFNLGKNRSLFCERIGSLEGCNVVNSSCKYFFMW